MKNGTEIPNIPKARTKRIVIVGSGFAGLKFLKKIRGKGYQIVLFDKNNFHQFQPLLYQVATAGLEPSAISFPVRKILQKEKDMHFRIAELLEVNPAEKFITTSIGRLSYDYLVISIGTTTNFFGNKGISRNALSMKTASDAILIRNTILEHFEKALLETDPEIIHQYLNIVLVGGGPTGVELAGALAEMKKYIFPKDYPELDLTNMRIVLHEASPRLLAGMSELASKKAKQYLNKLGVEVFLNSRVTDYDGACMKLADGTTITSKTVIWAAGVQSNSFSGLPASGFGRGNRILVDRYNRIIGHTDIFALGDACLMKTPNFPDGHPQLAQAAIQQAKLLATNLPKMEAGLHIKKFEYKNKGALATIGRNLAVADLPFAKIKGFLAWFLWSFVHLFTIVGVKNRLFIFLNWSWNYFTYDQSLRLLIKPKMSKETQNHESKT